MLKEALEQHAAILEQLEGKTLSYQRTGVLSQDIKGILDQVRQDEATAAGRGATVSAKLVDVLIRPHHLEDNGFGDPQDGDLLVIESTDRRLEVRAHNSLEPCFIWSDAHHTFYRIHCVELRPSA